MPCQRSPSVPCSSSNVEPFPHSSILYEDEGSTLFLLDIPASLSLAQGGIPNRSVAPWIRSIEPLQQPHRSTEPRTEKARANLSAQTTVYAGDEAYRIWIRKGLAAISSSSSAVTQFRWCFPRIVFPSLDGKSVSVSSPPTWRRSSPDRPRQASPSAVQVDVAPVRTPGHALRANIAANDRMTASTPHTWRDRFECPLVLSSDPPLNRFSAADLCRRLVSNPSSSPTKLTEDSTCTKEYLIPPRSSFIWHDISCRDSRWVPSLKRAIRRALPGCTPSAMPGQFDAVILDPPWNNRSAKRKGAYRTSSYFSSSSTASRPTPDPSPFSVLEGFMGDLIAPNGLVLCWITHSQAVRRAAMEAFAKWGVELEEEWIWAKVTVRGEPVYELDGAWRRPWEMCLVGRKSSDGLVGLADEDGDEDEDRKAVQLTREGEAKRASVTTRIIFAVPDLHSRKPCLKELLDRMLPSHGDVRVLELFARNLTSGWWAWGDDVLRFQREENWEEIQTGHIQ